MIRKDKELLISSLLAIFLLILFFSVIILYNSIDFDNLKVIVKNRNEYIPNPTYSPKPTSLPVLIPPTSPAPTPDPESAFNSNDYHSYIYENDTRKTNLGKEIIIPVSKEAFGVDQLELKPLWTDSGVINCYPAEGDPYVFDFHICATSGDFTAGRHGYFTEKSAFFEKEGAYYSGLFHFRGVPIDAVTYSINNHGLEVLKIKHMPQPNEYFPNASAPGTPQQDIGAIINLKDSEFSAIGISMNFTEKYTPEVFDELVNNIRIDSSISGWKTKIIKSDTYENFKLSYPNDWNYTEDNGGLIHLQKETTSIAIKQPKPVISDYCKGQELYKNVFGYQTTATSLRFMEKSKEDSEFNYYQLCMGSEVNTNIGQIEIQVEKGKSDNLYEALTLLRKIIIFRPFRQNEYVD